MAQNSKIEWTTHTFNPHHEGMSEWDRVEAEVEAMLQDWRRRLPTIKRMSPEQQQVELDAANARYIPLRQRLRELTYCEVSG